MNFKDRITIEQIRALTDVGFTRYMQIWQPQVGDVCLYFGGSISEEGDTVVIKDESDVQVAKSLRDECSLIPLLSVSDLFRFVYLYNDYSRAMSGMPPAPFIRMSPPIGIINLEKLCDSLWNDIRFALEMPLYKPMTKLSKEEMS